MAGRLVNTITDGDVRRGILSGVSLDEQVSTASRNQVRHSAPDSDDSAVHG